MSHNERGSVGLQFLAVSLLIGAGLTGLTALLGTAARLERRSVEAYEGRRELEKAISETIDLMRADPTPDVDSARESYLGVIEARSDGITIELKDLSSKLNPNYIDGAILEGSGLSSLLGPGGSAAALEALRESSGPSTKLDRYSSVLPLDADEHFSCFGWANINVADLRSLSDLYAAASGNAGGAKEFAARVKAARDGHTTITPSTLAAILGEAATYPFINCEPVMNVHFIERTILESLVAYPPFGITQPEDKARALIAARDDHDIGSGELISLLGVDGGNRLLQYIGRRTWFWEVRAHRGSRECIQVVAAIPGASPNARFRVVETRHEP